MNDDLRFRPPYVPGYNLEQQLNYINDKLDCYMQTYEQVMANCYKTLHDLETTAELNGSYFSNCEVNTQEGYNTEQSAIYKIIQIDPCDKNGRPIKMKLNFAYNNTTNSKIEQSIFGASKAVSADKMFIAQPMMENGWYGHVIQQGQLMPSDQTQTTLYTFGFTKHGTMKVYSNAIDVQQLFNDGIENSMGCSAQIIINGALSGEYSTAPNYNTQTSRICVGQNYQNKKTYVLICDVRNDENHKGLTTEECANILLGYGCNVAVEVNEGDTVFALDKGYPMVDCAENTNGYCFWYVTKAPEFTNTLQAEIATLYQQQGRCAYDYCLSKKKITGIETDIDDLQEEINTINTNIDNINNNIEQLQNDIDNINTNIDAINGNITNIKGDISEINSVIDGINSNLSGITKRVETCEDNISTLQTNYTALQQLVNNINTTVNNHTGSIATLQGQVGNLQTSLTAVQSQLTSLDNTVATIIQTIATIEETLNEIKTSITNVQSRVAVLESDNTTNKTDIAQLQSNVTELQTQISDLKEHQSPIGIPYGDSIPPEDRVEGVFYLQQTEEEGIPGASFPVETDGTVTRPAAAPLQSAAVLGKTTETGTGDKSPQNPYTISGAEPTKITVTGASSAETEEIELPTLSAPLYSLPDGTADCYEAVSGKEVRHTKCMKLDGTEDWWRSGTGVSGKYRFGVSISNIKLPASGDEKGSVTCSHYPTVTSGTAGIWGAHQGVSIDNSAKAITFYDESLSESPVTDWKAFLSAQYQNGTPVTVVYELSEPEETARTPKEIQITEDTGTIRTNAGKLRAVYLQVPEGEAYRTQLQDADGNILCPATDAESVLGLSKVAKTGKYSDLTGAPVDELNQAIENIADLQEKVANLQTSSEDNSESIVSQGQEIETLQQQIQQFENNNHIFVNVGSGVGVAIKDNSTSHNDDTPFDFSGNTTEGTYWIAYLGNKIIGHGNSTGTTALTMRTVGSSPYLLAWSEIHTKYYNLTEQGFVWNQNSANGMGSAGITIEQDGFTFNGNGDWSFELELALA